MNKKSTEEKILQAAETEFIENGFKGARMQAIADRAGINKALLHYYFRTKEKLFEVIFRTVFKFFVPKMFNVFEREDLDIFEKIRIFVSEYINLIVKNPHIPGFIIHELSSKKSNIGKLFAEQNIDVDLFIRLINSEIEKGTIKDIMPEQLIINIIALSVFPVIAAPIATGVLFDGDEKKYQALLKERDKHVADFIINSIKA